MTKSICKSAKKLSVLVAKEALLNFQRSCYYAALLDEEITVIISVW